MTSVLFRMHKTDCGEQSDFVFLIKYLSNFEFIIDYFGLNYVFRITCVSLVKSA